MINIGIYGANGKMGKEIISCLKEYKDAKVSVLFSIQDLDIQTHKDIIVTNKFDEFFNNCDVIIDFTSKDGTQNILNNIKQKPKPLVIGTTGLDEDTINKIEQLSKTMPILYASNMSLGVAILNKVAQITSKALRDFDVEIVEMHHKHKKDSPSGTALWLANNVAQARNLNLKENMITGRQDTTNPRKKDEIGVMSLRGGDIVGQHTIGFYNDGEFVKLSHTATSRATFAKGAIKAAVWLKNKKAGLYNINDCLEI